MSASDCIYQTAQIRELEALANTDLMARAGKAAFDFMHRRWPHAKSLMVVCGNGNNGGDGYVLAHHAHEHGLQVSVYQVGNHSALKGKAQQAMQRCLKSGVKFLSAAKINSEVKPDLIIDAICGIGLTTPLRSDVLALIDKLHAFQSPIFALDVPTGVNADTGALLGGAVHATATMTFIGWKLGLMTGAGASCTGELVMNDLELAADIFDKVDVVAEKLSLSLFADYLKPRPRDWHKGLSGHVLVIGGDVGYSGASQMAAEAALRVGAGLVSVATHPENAASISAMCPEIMAHGIASADQLKPLLQRANVIVLGPGLGQSDWAKALWKVALDSALPKVVDADALNLLADQNRQSRDWVLTPHPGEAARLLGCDTVAIQKDRLVALQKLQQRYDGVCVLKGAGSMILAPDGVPGLCDKGNPGMSTAGMGDILSGAIGGLIAQRIPLREAAELGVCLHAMAGDMAAEEGQRGTIATDLLPHLRRLCNL